MAAPSYTQSRIQQAVTKNKERLEEAIQACLEYSISRISGSFGETAYSSIWFAAGLIDLSNLEPLCDVGVGDQRILYEKDSCLADDCLFQATLCAQTARDTMTVLNEPIHVLAAEGKYFLRPGAIIFTIGREEIVISTAFGTGQMDHEISGKVKEIFRNSLGFTAPSVERRADYRPDHPEYRKYPSGDLVIRVLGGMSSGLTGSETG